MSEVARLKTEIQARKFRCSEISAEIDRRIRDIKDALAGHAVMKPDQIRLANVADLARELETLQEEYLRLQDEIAKAQKELG